MSRSRRAVRWLQPGLVVKRWMLTSGLGLVIALLGAAVWADLQPIYWTLETIRWLLSRATQVLRPWRNDLIGVFFLDLVDRGGPEPLVQLDLSLAVGLHWVNLHVLGALEVTDGAISRLEPVELVVSGWALPSAPDELRALANDQLADARSRDRELDENLDRIGGLTVRGGKFWLRLPGAR